MTQDEALAILESGESVLLTGAAGAGKTYVLNKFIRRAKKRGRSVAVTATTGLAATHLNGTTIHAWSGIGVYDDIDKYAIAKLGKSRQELIKKADVLVIDEISMLHDFRLDMVDQVLRTVREDETPFGGVQVILCGDFFQLPPVNRRDSRQGTFVTNSQVWLKNVFSVCYLETQFRQREDQIYSDILNGIRAGVLTRNQLSVLQSRSRAVDDPFANRTRLLTVNVDVDTVNERQLDELRGDLHEYVMETQGLKKYLEQLRRSCLAPEVLRLKKDAQVMFIKNAADRKYANGSLGRVVEFESETDYPVIELTNGRRVTARPDSWELMDGDKRRATIIQLPLRLAWAITVHKSQGMTLDGAKIDLSNAFVEGMGYVALSRVRGLQQLILDGLNGMALRVSPAAKQIDAELRAKSGQALQDFAAHITAWQAKEDRGEHEQEMQSHAAEVAADPVLFDRLRTWRSGLARTAQLPPYIVAHDKTLADVSKIKPISQADLLKISGMGSKKIEKYGPDILRIVQTYLDER